MKITEIIAKKRDGFKLNKEEIEYFVNRIYRRKNYRLSSSSFSYGDIYKWYG